MAKYGIAYWAAWPWQWAGTHLPSAAYPAGTQGTPAGHACCAIGVFVVAGGVHPITAAVAAKPIRPASAKEKARI
jgi:hypothetical protein